MITYGRKKVMSQRNQWNDFVNLRKESNVSTVEKQRNRLSIESNESMGSTKSVEKAEKGSSDEDTKTASDVELNHRDLKRPLRKSIENVFDEIVEEPKKKRVVRGKKATVKSKRLKKPVVEYVDDMGDEGEAIDMIEKEIEIQDTEMTVSEPVSDTLPSLVGKRTRERKGTVEVTVPATEKIEEVEVPVAASETATPVEQIEVSRTQTTCSQTPTNSIKETETLNEDCIHSTPAKQVSVDFGDVSPISAGPEPFEEPVEEPLETAPEQALVPSLKQLKAQKEVKPELSKLQTEKKPVVIDIPIHAASPKRTKRVGQLGRAVNQKTTNKLSFNMVKSASQNAIIERTSSPLKDTRTSPVKNQAEKRAIVMPVRKANTVTYGRSNMPIETNTIDASLPNLGNIMDPVAVESDREEEDHGIDEGLDSSDDEGKPRVRGIHELREAGHSKRTRDELEYITEGLKSPLLNIRRSTSMEMLKKLGNPQFVSNVRIHGYVNKIFEVICHDGDMILHVTLCLVMCALGSDFKNLECINKNELLKWSLESISKYLEKNILLDLPKKRYDKTLVLELIAAVEKIPEFGDYGVDIVAHLQELLLRLVEMDPSLSITYLPPSRLLEHISNDLESINLPLSAKTNSNVAMLELLTCSPVETTTVYNEHQLLDRVWFAFNTSLFSMLQAKEIDMQEWKSVPRMVKILLNYHGPKLREISTVKQDYIDILLKSLLQTSKKEHDTLDFWFDLHLLILGLFINVLESPGTHGDRLLSKQLSIDCKNKCNLHCRCKSKQSGIEIVCALFEKRKNSDPTIAMKSAYHAVLIGKLVELYPSQKQTILSILPEKTFDPLIELIQDFALYHDALKSNTDSKDTTRQSLDSLIALLSS